MIWRNLTCDDFPLRTMKRDIYDHMNSSQNVSIEKSEIERNNELYENIGLKVLDMWHSDDELPSFNSTLVNDPIKQLEEILNTPIYKQRPNWTYDLREILENLSPADYAIYGKRIAMYLLNNQIHESKDDITIESLDIQFDEKSSFSSIPVTPVKKSSNRSPKHHSPKYTKKHDISIISTAYPQFPQWLPTMHDASE